MGFCTPEDYEEFFRSVPEFERMLVRSGIRLLKWSCCSRLISQRRRQAVPTEMLVPETY
jgi:polyphosphate kinase 2 (PPK2 family)